MKDFDQVWAELKPWLDEREAFRKTAVNQFFVSIMAGVGLGGAVALVAFSMGLDGMWALLIVIGSAVLGGMFRFGPIGDLHSEVKTQLNTRVADLFELSYREDVFAPPRFDAFRSHGLVPKGDRQSFEDQFSGAFNGAEFELYEAHLEERRRSRRRTYYVTVFRGVLIRIVFPRTIEGVTLVTRDKGWFNTFERWGKTSFGQKLERIGLVDPDFERLFEVYGTDQVMARYLLTPSFMERLLELEALLKGKNVRCVFDEALGQGAGRGELLIAAETGNQFEPGSMFSPIDQKEPVERLHSEIELIQSIVKLLLEPASER